MRIAASAALGRLPLRALTQQEFLDLACAGLWHLAEHDRARALVAGEMRAAPGNYVLSRGRCDAGPQLNERARRFAPSRNATSGHGDFAAGLVGAGVSLDGFAVAAGAGAGGLKASSVLALAAGFGAAGAGDVAARGDAFAAGGAFFGAAVG